MRGTAENRIRDSRMPQRNHHGPDRNRHSGPEPSDSDGPAGRNPRDSFAYSRPCGKFRGSRNLRRETRSCPGVQDPEECSLGSWKTRFGGEFVFPQGEQSWQETPAYFPGRKRTGCHRKAPDPAYGFQGAGYRIGRRKSGANSQTQWESARFS